MNYVTRQGRRIAVETVETGITIRRRRAPPFVKVPLSLAAALAKATKTPKAMLWMLLLYEAWRAKGKPFTLSNVKLARYGVNRERKRQALAEMKAAGLIMVEQKGKQSPIITFLADCHEGVTVSRTPVTQA
jgi:hypothetical protein